MTRVRIKIDGLTSRGDIQLVSDAGVDAAGFIVGFPESPRNLTPEEVGNLLPYVPPFISTVVAVRMEEAARLVETLNSSTPSTLQLYGSAKLAMNMKGISLIKVVHAKPNTAIKEATEARQRFDAVLIDSLVSGRHGGTGVTHDWRISRDVRDAIHPTPLILAGGLGPNNVREAVISVRPYGVDVSSGVESEPGSKDPEKVNEFVRIVRGIEL